MTSILRARVWCFGDNISTDLLMPMISLWMDREERPKYVLEGVRPGWAEQVEPGDILIGGLNFGTGSSRPAAQTMRDLGLGCVLAESINGLFFRNCVNLALPALEMPGITAAFSEGDIASIDFDKATVTNESTGATLVGTPWIPLAKRILAAGGLVQMLEDAGQLQPAGWAPPA